jgi:MFS family permease
MKLKFALPFYFVSFLEGGALMASEILGAKIVAPYFGTSLFVWSSILATTLVGLATGYYTGGFLSLRFNSYKILISVLSIAFLILSFIPMLSVLLMELLAPLPLKAGSLISSFLLIFPLMTCFGIVSPVIIRIISEKISDVGSKAGAVYAVSTAGGIFMTFFVGFYTVPHFGIIFSTYFTAALLFASVLIAYFAVSTVQKTILLQG